jgi:CrcB protein
LFLATGILGGYTTFSSYAYEIYALGAQGSPFRALAYACGSIAAGVLAAFLGVAVARFVASPV